MVVMQVAYLQAQVAQAKAQLAQNMVDHHQSSRNAENQWVNNSGGGGMMGSSSPPFAAANHNYYCSNISPQSSLDSINDGINQEIQSCRSDDEAIFQHYSKKMRPSQTDLSELQALAFRMMNNHN